MQSCPSSNVATSSSSSWSSSSSAAITSNDAALATTEPRYLGACSASRFLGVTGRRTLRRWHKLGLINATRTPGNQRVYDVNSIVTGDGGNRGVAATANTQASSCRHKRESVIYARVSSAKQREDLERQIQALTQKFSGHRVISDIGSGINFKRPGLQKLIKRCLQGHVESVVVAHRDRLCRIAFDFFDFLFKTMGVTLVVVHNDDNDGAAAASTTGHSELGEDLMAIVHVFSARHYGKRRYGGKNKAPQSKATSGDGGGGDDDGGPTKRRRRGRGRPRKCSVGPGTGNDDYGGDQEENATQKVGHVEGQQPDHAVCEHSGVAVSNR